jgi:predicted regulator of Ras-like GTPase activity (Roadblock/LC7/MglB family)
MKDLLKNLTELPCVQGSMLITSDGILIAAELQPGLDQDAVAALSSSMLMTLKRSMAPFSPVLPEETILTASEGKLIFLSVGNACLVAVTRRNLKLESELVEIRSIARKIRQRCELSV